MLGLEYRLILSMFYVLCQIIVGYLISLCNISGLRFWKSLWALVSLTSVFKTCYSPDLEQADLHSQSFQYTVTILCSLGYTCSR